MADLVYWVTGLLGFSHPLHPVVITLLVGSVMGALLVQITAIWLKKPYLFATARHLTVIGFIFWFPSVLIGVIDWIYFYGASQTMHPILFKSLGAGVLFITLLSSILIFKKVKESSKQLFALYAASALMVSVIGYFGAEIVFQKAAPQSAQTEAVVQTDGSKTITEAGFTVNWKIVDNIIKVSVSYKTTGWVGIGFGQKGTMKDSHIILGYVGEDGKPVVEDHFGNAGQKHSSKKSLSRADTLLERNATLIDGLTTVSFSMPLKTNDPGDPVLVPGESITIILARAESAKDVKTYHGGPDSGGHAAIKTIL